MRKWANFHSHTHYCDGSNPPESYVQEAIRLGLPAYGFSSHAPLPFKTTWNIADNRLADYALEVRQIQSKYKNDIEVHLGLEIDFIPGIAGRNKHILKGFVLDYFIGSVHFVNCFSDGLHWNIDTTREEFIKGLKEIFQNDIRKAATRFWEITRQMIEEDRPDIIGHLDKIKMFNTDKRYFSEDESWYADQVELTLELIRKHNCMVEINTRGYYNYGQPDLYPGEWIIRRLAGKGIPVMINSDSHRPDEIVKGMDYAAKTLLRSGIDRVSVLHNNAWKDHQLVNEGIVFD